MMGVWVYEYRHICTIVNMKRTEENLLSSPLLGSLLSFLLCMPGWLICWHTGFVLSLPPVSHLEDWNCRWPHCPCDFYTRYENSNPDPLACPASTFPRWLNYLPSSVHF